MKFKHFARWVTDHISDKRIPRLDRMILCAIAYKMYDVPFWRREKEWNVTYKSYISRKIHELESKFN